MATKSRKARSSSLRVGFVMEGLEGPFQSSLFKGVALTLRAKGVGLVCFSGNGLRSNPGFENQGRLIEKFLTSKTFDVLIAPAMMGTAGGADQFDRILDRLEGLPIISIGPEIRPSIPYADIADGEGMGILTDHLIEAHGVRRFVYLEHLNRAGYFSVRKEHFLKSLSNHGYAPESAEIWRGLEPFDTPKLIGQIHRRIRSRGGLPEVFVAPDDHLASAAVAAVKELGYGVPDDVLVTGFDGTPEAYTCIPAITGVSRPVWMLGAAAAELAVRLGSGESIPHRNIVPATLDIQESCGCIVWREGLRAKHGHKSDATPSWRAEKNQFAAGLTDRFPLEYRFNADPSVKTQIARLMTIAGIKSHDRFKAQFIDTMNDVLVQAGVAGLDPFPWTVTAEKILRYRLDIVANPGERERCDRILRLVQSRGGDIAQRFQFGARVADEPAKLRLNKFASGVANVDGYADLANQISSYLGTMRVPKADFWVFTPGVSGELPSTAHASLHIRDGCRSVCETPQAAIGWSEELERAIRKSGKGSVVVIDTIRTDPEPLGVAFYLWDSYDTAVFIALRISVGNAVIKLGLLDQITRHTEELTKANAELIRLHAAEQAYLAAVRRELDLAAEIQQDFLPASLPALKGWNFAAFFQPSQEVSGDFYDVFMLPGNRTAIVIADVCGKSVSAALYMALVRSLIRAFSIRVLQDNPLEVVSHINDYIINNHRRKSTFMFVTLFYGILDTVSGKLSYVNAGHPPPLVVEGTRIRAALGPCGPAIGIDPEATYTVKTEDLKIGDSLFAYTDGVTEAQDSKGVLLGKETIFRVLGTDLLTPQTTIDMVRQKIAEHSRADRLTDDVTMVAFKRI